MKISELGHFQKQHLAWRLDHKTACGMLTAIKIADGKYGDPDLVEVFEKFGDRSPHSAKIHARKVIGFIVDPHGIIASLIDAHRSSNVYELGIAMNMAREYMEHRND